MRQWPSGKIIFAENRGLGSNPAEKPFFARQFYHLLSPDRDKQKRELNGLLLISNRRCWELSKEVQKSPLLTSIYNAKEFPDIWAIDLICLMLNMLNVNKQINKKYKKRKN